MRFIPSFSGDAHCGRPLSSDMHMSSSSVISSESPPQCSHGQVHRPYAKRHQSPKSTVLVPCFVPGIGNVMRVMTVDDRRIMHNTVEGAAFGGEMGRPHGSISSTTGTKTPSEFWPTGYPLITTTTTVAPVACPPVAVMREQQQKERARAQAQAEADVEAMRMAQQRREKLALEARQAAAMRFYTEGTTVGYPKMEISQDYDDDDRSFAKSDRKFKRRVPDDYICSRCGQRADHWIGDCSLPKVIGPPPEGYICHRCHCKGHWMEDCGKSWTPRTTVPLDAPPKTYVCRRCGDNGHWIENCRKFSTSGEFASMLPCAALADNHHSL
jgi:ribosomal protein L40E